MESAKAKSGIGRISILDLNPGACRSGHCNELPNLIERCLPPLKTSMERGPSQSSANSSVLIVRPARTESLPELLRSLRSKFNQAGVLGLFCAGWENPNRPLESMVDQLDEFTCCPFNETDIVVRIRRLLGNIEGTDSPSRSHDTRERHQLQSLVGESECFLQVVDRVPIVAATDATVVILGETGTGKELFARAIHYTSPRRDKPFLPLNCGTLPDHLFENEMFGHAKGAFTDASSEEKGLLAIAEGGTLLLDEVDSLSLAAQIKLLRFLQDRQYRPLGSSRMATANVRILSATNVDLRKQVENKLFREDLYHRLNIVSLRIPPLRGRGSDIPLLASHLLSKYANQYGRHPLHLSPQALRKLSSYSWPGNVRELEGVILRAVILHPQSTTINASQLDLPLPREIEAPAELSLQAAKMRAIAQFEQSYLTNVLTAHQGNISRAARAAGKERRSFQRLLQKHGLGKNILPQY